MDNKEQVITLKTELPIGTQFWVMQNNRIMMGMVAAYNVYVTSYVDHEKGWADQLFNRLKDLTHKNIYKQTISYEVKLEDTTLVQLHKNGTSWMLSNRKIYFSKEELIKEL